MTAVLQLKTRILGKLEAVYFLYRFSHSKRLAQLSVSPVPQSSPTVQSHSPVPSPVHRIETAKILWLILCVVCKHYSADLCKFVLARHFVPVILVLSGLCI